MTLTATVMPSAATGTVTFKDGSATLGTGTLSSGKATLSTSTLAGGAHSITASYGGDKNYNSSTSSVLTQAVNKASTAVALTSSANPTTYGSSVTFTATVSPSTATGSVTFKDGSTTLGTGTVGSGKATFSTSTLAGGSHSITASYGGDKNYNSSTSSVLTQTVNKASAAVTLTSSANPSAYGSSVTFTATVTPSAVTGTVTFLDGSTTLGTGTISRGKATFSTSTLAGGSHSITASYSGDTTYNGSTSTVLTQTVNKANTTVTLTSSANPSTFGSSVTFTATVSPSTATGTATFKDGSTTLGTGTVSAGKATFSTSTLAATSHSMTASYAGDTNYNSSTSPVLTQTVNKASTTVTLTSSLNPSAYSSAVTFTATVTPSLATGTVTIKDGSTTLGTGTLSGGTATYTTSTLAVGSHSMTVSYAGDTNDNSSTSPVLTQTVNKASTAVTLTSSANPSAYGSSVTFTAAVTPSTATGTVTFLDGSSTLGTGTISNGSVTYRTSALAVGSHSMTASYGGDTNDAGSSSPTLTQTVNKASTTVTLTSSTNPLSLTFTATVTPATATGTVTFLDGSATLGTGTLSGGSATFTASALAVGSHSMTASYGGDSNYSSSTSAMLTVAVIPPSITASASPSPDAGGWNNTNVTVSFSCTQGTYPMASCPAAVVVSTDGASQQITGTVTDSAGNRATATIPPINLDKTPPAISITSPGDGSVFSTPQLTLSGAVNDALSGVSGVTCNSVAATISANAFSCEIALNPGVNPISVQATDAAGNQSSASITTTFVFGPKVAITAPTPLALFSSNPITVSGTIDDAKATVSVNGVAGTINGNEFAINGVPLREAKNLLTVTAVNTGGGVGSDTVTVYLDTTPPSVHIDTPTDGAIVTSQTVTVTGMVNDLVNGTVNQGEVTVSVNGAQGTVSNRSFQASNVLLVPGDNLITATAKDIAGNTSQHQIHVRLQAVVNQQKIMALSGDGQTAPIGTVLAQPLVVQVVDSLGVPIPNRTLAFSVERSDGTLLANPQQGRQITLQTDPSGQASVQLQLGTRVGVGNNVVSVASPGFVGEVMFSETSTVGSPATIHVVSGDMQKGQGGLTLPEPLQVIVTDSGGNPVPGVQVTYTVTKGGGSLEGNQTVAKTTDNDGKAAAVLTLALEEGINNNVVTADFAGDINAPAGFTSSGVAGGIVSNTAVSGIVLDNANVPIPNATASIKDTNFSARTDAQGQFTIKNAPVGNIVLYVDGSTSSRPETFPTLSFQMATVSGIDNKLSGPIFLPPLDTNNSQVVGGNQDIILTMNGVPGVKYTVFANSVTFPDGSHIGRVTLSQVHADKVPMVPPNGSAPTLVATLQPAGVKFDPPIRMELPNTDGLAPDTVVELFSFHHDVEQFVTEGTARVSQDGSVVVSDPGFGLTVSGWHGSGPPVPPPPTCGNGCNTGDPCSKARVSMVRASLPISQTERPVPMMVMPALMMSAEGDHVRINGDA